MPDAFAPRPFLPSDRLDHVTIELKISMRIGVEDCSTENETNNFIALVKDQIKSTGASAFCTSFYIGKKSPLLGSLREKLLHDHEYDKYTANTGTKEDE